MEPDALLCSRNARSRTPLVGRAQWKINQPPSLERERASLEGKVARQLAWSPCSQSPHDNKIGSTPTLVLCPRNARPEKGLVRRPHRTNMGALPREKKQASL